MAGGPAMDTASRPSASASPREVQACATSKRSARRAVLAGSVPTRATTSKPACGVPEHGCGHRRRCRRRRRATAQTPRTAADFAGPSAAGGIATGGRPTGDKVALGAELLALDIRAVPWRVVGRVIGEPGCDRAADLGRGGVRQVEAFQFGRVQGHALGGDEAGVDVVGGNALVAQLDGQNPGGFEQAGFADRVADAVTAHVERIGVGHAGGDVQDGPLAPFDHAGNEQLDQGQRRHDVDVDLFLQIGQIEVQHRGLRPFTGVDGVVDKNVDMAPRGEHFSHGEADGERVGQVHPDR